MEKNEVLSRYFGYDDNYKVTYPHDIEIVEILMKRREAKKNSQG